MEGSDLVIYRGVVHLPAINKAETLCGIPFLEIREERAQHPTRLTPFPMPSVPLCEDCQWANALRALAHENRGSAEKAGSILRK